MKNILFTLMVMVFFGCNGPDQRSDLNSTWAGARWVGLEKLPDSLKIVPGLHGLKKGYEGKYKRRSTVPLFRKTFEINKTIKKALVNISGLGQYELYINGEKIGDRFLAPGWTYYQKRILYNSFDVTERLQKGENVLGAIVGNGFFNINNERYFKLLIAYGYPQLIFNLTVTYDDGTTEHILSDEQCKVSPSPIIFSSIYGGEDYDARLEQPGWNTAGFDDSGWKKAVVVDAPAGELVPEKDFPLKVMQEFKVRAISRSGGGRTIYDFGQNASGIVSLKVRGNRGAEIRIRPDELVNEHGEVTQHSGKGPYEFNYTLKGGGLEEWRPRFTYYGFRYAEVEITEPEGADGKTEIVELKMLHTRNSSPAAGSFSCSDTLFNRVYELINWAIRSNMASVLTDCPHREKLGWLEQTYLMGPSIHYNYNIQKFYNKIIDDMIDSQTKEGLVPDIAPEYVVFTGGFRDSPEWGSAAVIVPWELYRWYGDKEALEKAYPMIKAYVEYLQGKAKNYMLSHGLGDWFDLGPKNPGSAQLTPKALTATSIFYYDLRIAAKIAGLLGYEEDMEAYTTLAKNVKKAFLKKFYDRETGVCSTGSQTAYAMPLFTGLIPEQDKGKVLNNLVRSIEDNDYALTAGDIGYHFLVRVLTDYGRSDVLYRMNIRTDRPGYGYQLKKGATSLTESWAALPNLSNDHLMLGHLMEWFYAGLGGISQDSSSVAYEKIIIAPKPVGNITRVNCSFNAPKGMIASNWVREGNTFKLAVEIPEGSVAKVVIPEKFKNFSCKVMNAATGKYVEVKIRDGSFDLETGKFNIVVK